MKNNFLAMILVLLVALMPNIVTAATITVGPSDCSAPAVNAAITGASEGDTIQLTCTGTVTWNSEIVLNGGKTLKGPGSKASNSWPLTINSIGSGIDAIISITNTANQYVNRVTGLKFQGGSGATLGIYSGGAGTGKDGNGAFRIDNNYFDKMKTTSRLLWLDGDDGKLTGLVDHNILNSTYEDASGTFVGQDWKGSSSTCYGYDSRTRPFVFGDSDFIFFEDNYFFNEYIETSGGGGRYVVRYNIFDTDSFHNDYLAVDGHGADTGYWNCVGVVGVEMYNNNITGNASYSYSQLADARGGKWLIYNNNAQSGRLQLNEYRALGLENYPTGGSCMSLDFNECNGAACCEAPCGVYNIQCPTDADVAKCWPLPNQVANTFLWNNLKNGQYLPPYVVETGYVRDYIVKNRDYWEPAYGLESTLPSTCTPDGNTFYGTTDSGKLFKCTANNVWTLQYTPYTYPHPLAVESTHHAASCSYDDVLATVNAAQSGDTVLIPVGSCTWNNQLVITKGINLVGAGMNNTVLTSNYAPPRLEYSWPDSFLITYYPSNPSANEPFRVSGLTIDCNAKCHGIMVYNPTINPISKIRIDHTKILNPPVNRPVTIEGTIYGVADNNEWHGFYMQFFGADQLAWQNLTFDFGTVDNFYVEDNLFVGSAQDMLIASAAGARWCSRYNTYDGSACTGGLFPHHDAHGNGPSNSHWSVMGVEIYNDVTIMPSTTNPNMGVNLIQQRGGKALIYNNKIYAYSAWGQEREEYNDADNPPASSPISGQPQHVSDSYWWNNLLNDKDLVLVDIIQTYDYGGSEGLVPQENREFWQQKIPFNGTSGVGVGLLSSRSSTCTLGVGYWANDTKTLYKCNSTNTWIPYYKPYIHPHPLTVAPFGTDICREGAISSSCWCEGMKSNGYCCQGYYQTISCDSCVLPGDINCDNVVNLADLKLVAQDFGKTSGFNSRADSDSNGVIDIFDVIFVASRFT